MEQAPPEATLTPRQRRLAQQRRKWEEEQRQRQGQRQERQKPPTAATRVEHALQQQPSQARVGAPSPSPGRPPSRSAAVSAPRSAPAAQGGYARDMDASSRGPPKRTFPVPTPATPATATVPAKPGPSSLAQSASSRSKEVATGAGRRDAAAAAAAAAAAGRVRAAAVPATADEDGLLGTASASVGGAGPASTSPASPSPSSSGHTAWPSLFAGAAGDASSRRLFPLSPDLDRMSGGDLASLARQWADELVRWQAANHGPYGLRPRPASNLSHDDAATTGAERATTGGPISLPAAAASVPDAAASRLALLRDAATAWVVRGSSSLGHQELADLVWAVAHYNRRHALDVLQPAMDVPFMVVPCFMPELRLEDFMSEVELRRDVIYLDDGSRAIEESRLTGWQSEIGATFKYSGKEMQPQAGGLSPHVLKVRDALHALTGVKYDSVLVNHYADGKCGMRYHVDPLYGRWTPHSAVVSLGDTRSFIFRSISDHATRWHYRVRNGDVVLMFGDCQERLQHCVRVERRAEDAGPRMSLVFKERLRGPDGQYLLA